MASEGQSPSRGSTPSIPLKRPLEDDHAPTISSPLNPNPPARSSAAPVREQRSKKDSLKKREASESTARPSATDKSGKGKKKGPEDEPLALSPLRYNHSLPTQAWQYSNKELSYVPHEAEPVLAPDRTELLKPVDHVENKKNFRYCHCVADPLFKHSHYYRQSDLAPHGPRMSRSDSDRNFYFDEKACRLVTNQKGWRMGRANVVAREGTFYYEVKIVKGVSPDGSPDAIQQTSTDPIPHVRAGWARRESPLDVPVGFDGYSYGLTDMRMEPMHRSRASKFVDDGDERALAKKKSRKKTGAVGSLASTTAFTASDSCRTGDVIGLSITLPSIALHRKIADGTYNPAVDRGAGETSGIDAETAPNIVRDRIPIPFRGAMYFESLEYRASKSMENYGDRGPFAKETPSPNHADASLRTLPGSSMKVWKNGKRVGAAFRDLLAFLPPASQPAADRGVRLGLDDGLVGYFPAISVFSGAIAEVNFGPDFWFPPEELQKGNDGAVQSAEAAEPMKQDDGDVQMGGMGEEGAPAAQAPKAAAARHPGVPMRAMAARYQEQIAEDVLYDIIDEVDFFMQDGGKIKMEDA